jgi:hypothetical protein
MALERESKTVIEADIAHGECMVVEQIFVLVVGLAGNSLDGNGLLTKSETQNPFWMAVEGQY